MISPEQSRAARAWLDWSQEDLAKRAHVALSTVRDFEKGRRTPIKNNLEAMRNCIQSAGIGLLFGDAGEAAGITAAMPAKSRLTQNQAAEAVGSPENDGHERCG